MSVSPHTRQAVQRTNKQPSKANNIRQTAISSSNKNFFCQSASSRLYPPFSIYLHQLFTKGVRTTTRRPSDVTTHSCWICRVPWFLSAHCVEPNYFHFLPALLFTLYHTALRNGGLQYHNGNATTIASYARARRSPFY